MNLPVGQAGETGRNGTPAANRPFRLESTARAAAHEAGLGAGPARRGEAAGPLPREVEVLPEPLPALDEPGPGYGWLGAVVIVGLLAFWELVARLGWVAPLYLPAPTAIAQELVRMAASGTLGASLTASLSRMSIARGICSEWICSTTILSSPGLASRALRILLDFRYSS